MAGGNKGDYYVPRGKVREEEYSEGSGEGGGTGRPGKDPCDISQVLNLVGIDESVVRRLKIGFCLDVHLLKQGGGPRIVAMHQGKYVGSITALPTLSRLTKCLEDGVPFKATVLEIHLPGLVKVKLERGTCP